MFTMPELPEAESIRRSLIPAVVGRRVCRVVVHRKDVVAGWEADCAPLDGAILADVRRHGKRLALLPEIGLDVSPETARAVEIKLGMSGRLWVQPQSAAKQVPPHTHVIWHLDKGARLCFCDPRRFGGINIWPNVAVLADHWQASLGPDALAIKPAQLHRRLNRIRRVLKAALLDQTVIAGLGNIYVDELLFASGLHPMTPATTITAEQTRKLVRRMRRLLERAIDARGSTFRDYRDGMGQSGGFQLQHRVYGRAGQPCCRCGRALSTQQVAARTTVFCTSCQPLVTDISYPMGG